MNWDNTLKYPIMTLCVLALVYGLSLMGIQIESITTDGVTFAEEKAALNQVSTEASDNKVMLIAYGERLSVLEQRTTGGRVPPITPKLLSAKPVKDSNAINLIKSVRVNGKSVFSGKTGYVFIGNTAVGSTTFTTRSILGKSKNDQLKSVKDVLINKEYYLDGNMVLRDGRPEPTKGYYLDKDPLGTLPKGTKVKIIPDNSSDDEKSNPYCANLGNKCQFWAYVEVVD